MVDFLPTVVVVFFTTIVTWRSPQRPAVSVEPVTVFFTVTTFFLGKACAAATAFVTGRASAATAAVAGAALFMTAPSGLYRANRSTWTWRRVTPARRRSASTRSV